MFYRAQRDRPESREPREGYHKDRSNYRYQSRNQPPQHNTHHTNAGVHPPPLKSTGPPPSERKEYYDSYTRYFSAIIVFFQRILKLKDALISQAEPLFAQLSTNYFLLIY